VVLTGGVDDVLEESSSLSRLKCRRTSDTNSGGKSNNTCVLSIMNETILARDEAFVVKSSADILKNVFVIENFLEIDEKYLTYFSWAQDVRCKYDSEIHSIHFIDIFI
jgi:hypothetical protein